MPTQIYIPFIKYKTSNNKLGNLNLIADSTLKYPSARKPKDPMGKSHHRQSELPFSLKLVKERKHCACVGLVKIHQPQIVISQRYSVRNRCVYGVSYFRHLSKGKHPRRILSSTKLFSFLQEICNSSLFQR